MGAGDRVLGGLRGVGRGTAIERPLAAALQDCNVRPDGRPAQPRRSLADVASMSNAGARIFHGGALVAMLVVAGCRDAPVEHMLAAYDDFLDEQYECQKDSEELGLSREEYDAREWAMGEGSKGRDCVWKVGHAKKWKNDPYFECMVDVIENHWMLTSNTCKHELADVDPRIIWGCGDSKTADGAIAACIAR